jgi:sec-independent protein translocase protein TatA
MFDTLALLSDVGGGEMIIVGIVALLLFGKNLPTQARNIGKAIGEFKKTLNEAKTEITKEMDNAAREAENVTRDLKLHETVSDINNTLRDDPGPKLDMPAHSPAPAPAAVASTPTALDAPSANSNSVTSTPTEKPRHEQSLSTAASLDNLERNIPAPTKIPPPV